MVKIWVRSFDCLRLDLTTAGVLGLQRRLSYCGICAATCFRLRGDNLNENPPFYHAYEWSKAGAQTQKVQLDSEVSDLEQDSLESEASLVSIKGKYLLGHRQWERAREKTIKASEGRRLLATSHMRTFHNVLHILQKYANENLYFSLWNLIRTTNPPNLIM